MSLVYPKINQRSHSNLLETIAIQGHLLVFIESLILIELIYFLMRTALMSESRSKKN